MSASNPVSDPNGAPAVESASSFLSSLGTGDILLLLLVILGSAAWFFSRRKSKLSSISEPKLTVIPATHTETSSGGFVDKMKASGKNVVVFYGSQTGTAEEFANRLSKDTLRFGLKGMSADPEEYDMEELPKLKEIDNSLIIFCVATYGEGDPTDNAQELHDWLKNNDADLSGLNYAVFALGNKTYEHYNAFGKLVDKRMAELGATRVFEIGFGDDDANIEDDFITWKDKFWPAVCEHFGLEQHGEEMNMRQFKLVIPENIPEEKIFHGEPGRLNSFKLQRPPFDAKNPFMAKVTSKRELHHGGDRSCMHIEIDITGSKLRYDAGDHVAVYPANEKALVDKLGEVLNVDLDSIFTLVNLDEDSSKKHPFPCPCSYRTAFTYYIDITTPVRTNVLKELSDYAADPEHKEFLKLMSSRSDEGKAKYNDWVIRDCRHIVAILEDLPSVKPPADHLCEMLPRLQARYYSISSSPKLYATTIHITAVLVDYETPTGRTNHGVATYWLKNKDIKPLDDPEPATAPVFVRRSQFRLPFKPQTPVIMIGPGTGVAPFRGFIQERDLLRREGKAVGETILYFGCRKKAEDFIYNEELEGFVESGTLTKLYTAFSRDAPEKVYVQHLLRDNGEEVWNLLEKGGHIYVCGDARNMARDVHEVIERICHTHGHLSESDAQAFVKKLESQRRYSADVWS
ncbi:NADPH--cytochrome P450 reductase-like [Paramacrobiotus metropolitanus]|uniref:NADPH--cytochrome P450 reductase-like n=1 Tax=Paramacrobiotus metropolitanus TaxID=2943436 RepID=UPI002445D329|nr:NADPH--cytochrome P450 reductase-like [Paramacrobiotus metropolitanus]